MEVYCFDELRENVRSLYDLNLRTNPSELAASSEFLLCGRLLLTSFQFTPLGFNRDPRNLTGYETEYVLLERYFSGKARGTIEETIIGINPEILHLIDWSRHFRSVTTHVSGLSLLIPHDLIGYDPSIHPMYSTLETRSAGGRILCLALDEFWNAKQSGSKEDTSLCAKLCISLVQQLFLDRNNDKPLAASLHANSFLVRSYIKKNLSNPNLSPDHLCKHLNVSRATLYRLFASEGGVIQHIEKLRLERCFSELIQAPLRRGEVRRVAESWGFHDASLFNRKFRRRFEVTPTECLGIEAINTIANKNQQPIWPINNWLQKA